MRPTSLRTHMMVSFCVGFGLLLGFSYILFYFFLKAEVVTQINRQLLETAGPIVASLIHEPNGDDVVRLDIPNQYFELLDPTGHVLQHSKNVSAPLNLTGMSLAVSSPAFCLARDGNGSQVRVAIIPFVQAGQRRIMVVGQPRGTLNVLDIFGRGALLLFAFSLLLSALIAAWYVSKSLAPLTAMTQQAAQMAKRVTNREEFWTPLAVVSPHDEMGRLAATFNQLLQEVDSVLHQLRQFVTDASHELRTPLSVLHGETELVLSRPRSAEEYRKSLEVFGEEVKKLTRIVEGLFTLSMADAGQLRLESEPLYINEVLEEACALVTPRARTKDITIATEINTVVAYVGDEAFLRDLFLVFLDNAIKYSPAKTCIRVSLKKLGAVVQASFADQGIGISSEHLPRIFERFYRAAPSNSADPYSGGLGLAIAQAIARAHGGVVECESRPGAGSTFTVTLPLPASTEAQVMEETFQEKMTS